jgi:hypothetical protein
MIFKDITQHLAVLSLVGRQIPGIDGWSFEKLPVYLTMVPASSVENVT